MEPGKTALERAFELAKNGEATSTEHIRRILKQEGYEERQVQGRALSRQLLALIKAAAKSRTGRPQQPS